MLRTIEKMTPKGKASNTKTVKAGNLKINSAVAESREPNDVDVEVSLREESTERRAPTPSGRSEGRVGPFKRLSPRMLAKQKKINKTTSKDSNAVSSHPEGIEVSADGKGGLEDESHQPFHTHISGDKAGEISALSVYDIYLTPERLSGVNITNSTNLKIQNRKKPETSESAYIKVISVTPAGKALDPVAKSLPAFSGVDLSASKTSRAISWASDSSLHCSIQGSVDQDNKLLKPVTLELDIGIITKDQRNSLGTALLRIESGPMQGKREELCVHAHPKKHKVFSKHTQYSLNQLAKLSLRYDINATDARGKRCARNLLSYMASFEVSEPDVTTESRPHAFSPVGLLCIGRHVDMYTESGSLLSSADEGDNKFLGITCGCHEDTKTTGSVASFEEPLPSLDGSLISDVQSSMSGNSKTILSSMLSTLQTIPETTTNEQTAISPRYEERIVSWFSLFDKENEDCDQAQSQPEPPVSVQSEATPTIHEERDNNEERLSDEKSHVSKKEVIPDIPVAENSQNWFSCFESSEPVRGSVHSDEGQPGPENQTDQQASEPQKLEKEHVTEEETSNNLDEPHRSAQNDTHMDNETKPAGTWFSFREIAEPDKIHDVEEANEKSDVVSHIQKNAPESTCSKGWFSLFDLSFGNDESVNAGDDLFPSASVSKTSGLHKQKSKQIQRIDDLASPRSLPPRQMRKWHLGRQQKGASPKRSDLLEVRSLKPGSTEKTPGLSPPFKPSPRPESFLQKKLLSQRSRTPSPRKERQSQTTVAKETMKNQNDESPKAINRSSPKSGFGRPPSPRKLLKQGLNQLQVLKTRLEPEVPVTPEKETEAERPLVIQAARTSGSLSESEESRDSGVIDRTPLKTDAVCGYPLYLCFWGQQGSCEDLEGNRFSLAVDSIGTEPSKSNESLNTFKTTGICTVATVGSNGSTKVVSLSRKEVAKLAALLNVKPEELKKKLQNTRSPAHVSP